MDIHRFDTKERSSQAVVFGELVFVAGQVARDRAGAEIGEQTREALARIDALLARAGSDKSRLLNATIWLRRAADSRAMNDAWVAWLPRGTGPAHAVIEGGMMADGWDVEITVIAAVHQIPNLHDPAGNTSTTHKGTSSKDSGSESSWRAL